VHPPLQLGVKRGVGGEAEEVGELDSTQYSAFLLMTQSDIEHIELCASNREKHQPKALQSLYKLKCLKKTEVLCKKVQLPSYSSVSLSSRIHRFDFRKPSKKRTDVQQTDTCSGY